MTPALSLTLLFALVQPGPATNSVAQQRLAQAKMKLLKEAWPLPMPTQKVAPGAIAKLLKLSVANGDLCGTPVIEALPRDSVMAFDNWPGLAAVEVNPAEQTLSLRHVSVAGMDEVGVVTLVNTDTDGRATLTRTRFATDGYRVVSLTRAPDAVGKIVVTLGVAFGDEDDPALADQFDPVELRAESFELLRLRHPRAVREHLGSLLRDLGAADLLDCATPAAAWQVLGDDVPVDAAEEQAVDALLVRLDAEDFEAREAARAALDQIGPAAVRTLRRRVAGLPPEPTAAVESFLAAQRPVPPDLAAALAVDADFLIDTLLLNDARLNAPAARRLAKVLGRPVNLDSAADRPAAVAALRPSLPTTNPR